MSDFDLTLSNYRCFAAQDPVRLPVRNGITSFIGPNNVGKSTLLKVFYELRPVLKVLSDVDGRKSWSRGTLHGAQVLGTGDPMEIFHNDNDLPVCIAIQLSEANEGDLSGFELTSERATPGQFRCHFTSGPSHRQVEPERVQEFRDQSIVHLIRELADALYLPATRIAIGESQGTSYDLAFGNAFISTWDQWKTGHNRKENAAIQRVTEDIASLFGFRRLEIGATPDKRDLHIAIDGKPFKLRELGAGLAQFIIVLGNVAIRRPTWLLIDEPEISLHASHQLDFLTTLSSYASCGTIFASHSLGLARCADRVFSLQRTGAHTVFREFERTGSFQEFLGEMSFAAYRELGYDAVLLVEGINDVKTTQQFLRLLHKEHRVVVLPIGGAQMIHPDRTQELSEILRLTRNVHVLIDSEKPSEEVPISEYRRGFLDSCRAQNMKAWATQKRALENYLSDRSIKVVFGQAYSSLGDFESRSAQRVTWRKSDSWRAAREMNADELLQTDVGKFLAEI